MGPLPKTNSCSYNAQGFPWSSSCFSFFFFVGGGKKSWPKSFATALLAFSSVTLKSPSFLLHLKAKAVKASKCFPDNAHIFRLSCWTKWKDGMSQPQTWGRKNDLNVGWGVAWPGRVCVGLCPPQALIYMLTAGMLLLRTTYTHTQGAHLLTHLHRSHQFRQVVHSIGSILSSKRGKAASTVCFAFFLYMSVHSCLNALYLFYWNKV